MFGFNLSKGDRNFIIIGVAGALLFLSLLIFDQGERLDSGKQSPLLGSISYRLNDARQKAKGSFVWDKATKDQSIHLGDSIYSGKQSQVQVSLNSGDSVSVGENDLAPGVVEV